MSVTAEEAIARIRVVIEEVENTHDGVILPIPPNETAGLSMYACKQCSGAFDPRQSEMVRFPCYAVQAAWWLRRIVIDRT